MNLAWLIVIVPLAFSLGFAVGAVMSLWNRPDDREESARQPDDPYCRPGE